MSPSFPDLDRADVGLSYAISHRDARLGSWVISNRHNLFVRELARCDTDAVGLPIAALGHHVGVVVGIGPGEQMGEFATWGRVARMTDLHVIGDRPVGIDISGAMNDPKSAIPPHAPITILDSASLPKAAARSGIADGVEVDLLSERSAARGVFSGHRPSCYNTNLKETG